MNTAEFIFKDNYIKISNFIYHKGDPYYNTTFDLEVRSGAFSGLAPCEYDIKELRQLVDDLSDMFNFKKQKTELKDICYGSTVCFEMSKTGHLEISGEIFGEATEHCLKFSFDADQSVLKGFISELQKLIND